MNASRIVLSRIIAFNWYGFRTIIDVNGLTLLCGETGTGKSALLDLIQFVMSAGSVKFNKAAAGESNARDLRGYCLCDTRTRLRDGQKRYLRRSGATVAALEFTWPALPGQEPRRETWGIRVQFESPSAQPSCVRFFVPCRMGRADMCDETGALLSEEMFRFHVKQDLVGDPAFTSNEAFQAEMGVARHLHFDDRQMRKTLPKAVAFELERDYERFIREFILEPNPPDVTNTRRSLDALRDAEERVTRLHDQQQRLERIATADRLYQAAIREAALYGHLRHALDYEEAQEKVSRCETSIQSLKIKHAENESRMREAVEKQATARRQLDDVKLIAGKEDPLLSDFDRLNRNEQSLQQRIEVLETNTKTTRGYLHERVNAWERWLRHAASIHWETSVDLAELTAARGSDATKALDAVSRLASEFNSVWNVSGERLKAMATETDALEAEQSRLEKLVAQLEDNRTAATPLLDKLRSAGMTAHTLARVVEVSTAGEAWWGVIETLLGQDRNAVLMAAVEDYVQAQALWMETPDAEPLIQPDKIPRCAPQPNALATFLETSHGTARSFLDWRLGQIVAVRDLAELTEHDRAATPTGAIKDTAILRHVAPEGELTLGEEGLRRLRIAKQQEVEAVADRLGKLKSKRDDVNSWLSRGKTGRLDQNDPPQGATELHLLPGLRKQLGELKSTISLIATPELTERLSQLHRLESDLEAANQTIGELKGPMTQFSTEHSKLEEQQTTAKEERDAATLKLQGSRAKLPLGILDAEIEKLVAAAVQSPGPWNTRRDQADTLKDTQLTDARSSREVRQQERSNLLSHPTHQDEFAEFDVGDDNNARFDQRLNQIRGHEVEHYTAIAGDRRADWEKRLQEDVLECLSERLQEAQQTIADFRRILRREVGGHRYVLSQVRDPIHRAMWKLIEQSGDGLQTGDPLHDWKLAEEIDAAKRELKDAVKEPEDKRAASLLDYRTYHRYDLKMVPLGQDDDSEGIISLQESGTTGSGGEGQAPFFVAMLAAFHRVYDRGQRGQQANLGLVVMDEAFSKLGPSYIADCLSLAEEFGLQLILALPMDRLGTMVRHADSIIQCRIEKRHDVKGVPIKIVNDVIYWERDRTILEALK